MNNFWGRSIAASGACNDPVSYEGFGPYEGLRLDLVNYNDIADLERALEYDSHIAAFVVEPI
jgi:ornithine--oxo-acid transaminase